LLEELRAPSDGSDLAAAAAAAAAATAATATTSEMPPSLATTEFHRHIVRAVHGGAEAKEVLEAEAALLALVVQLEDGVVKDHSILLHPGGNYVVHGTLLTLAANAP
jgi:hypothetical protein